jgi:hypothetical protein
MKTERWWEKFEEKVYLEQEKEIKRKYGRKATESVNWGWGVDAGNDYISVSSKVYGYGVLTSLGTLDGNIKHEWRE